RTIGLRAIPVIRMPGPVGRRVVIAPGGNVQFAVAIKVQNGGAFREGSEPISVPRGIVHRAVDLDNIEQQFPGSASFSFGRTAGGIRNQQAEACADRYQHDQPFPHLHLTAILSSSRRRQSSSISAVRVAPHLATPSARTSRSPSRVRTPPAALTRTRGG